MLELSQLVELLFDGLLLALSAGDKCDAGSVRLGIGARSDETEANEARQSRVDCLPEAALQLLNQRLRMHLNDLLVKSVYQLVLFDLVDSKADLLCGEQHDQVGVDKVAAHSVEKLHETKWLFLRDTTSRALFDARSH